MFIKPQARENVRALLSAAAIGSTVGLAIGGAYLAGGLARATVVHAQIQRLAGAASGGFSDTALNAATGENDPAALAIAKRHDPFTSETDPHEHQVATLMDRLQARQAARNASTAKPVQAVAAQAIAVQAAETLKKPMVLKAAFVRPTLSDAAEPFHLRGALDQSRDLECLTQAVYYESRGESHSGQQAVAQVILNRVRHPAFPKSVCGVVFQGAKSGGCQFSFACDNQPHHPMENAAWRRSESVAAQALDGQVMAEVGDATHFHAAGHGSNWSAGLLKVAQIGAHVFYRFGGHNGAPSMFHGQPMPSDGSSGPRPVFASLALPGLGSAPSPAQFVASASAAVEHAASVVENVAKGVTSSEPAKAATVVPAPAPKPQAAPVAEAKPAAASAPAV